MFKLFKSKRPKTDEIVNELKKTESNFINSVNEELIKMNAMYNICPEKKAEKTDYIAYIGCTSCGKCKEVI